MSIYIREFMGSEASKEANLAVKNFKKKIEIEEGYADGFNVKDGSIIQLIESIHVGPTRNGNWYTEEALKSSIESWTTPYEKPLIMHHNEKDGKIIGRIILAEYVTSGTRSGTPAIVHTCYVPDKEGIEQIKDGRLKTVSIGAIAHDIRCSICGEQIELDDDGNAICGHVKGEEYDVNRQYKTCYWNIYNMEAKELSYVIVPSDIYAHNLKTISASKESFKKYLKENLGGNTNMTIQENQVEKNKVDLTEGQVVNEDSTKVEGQVTETEKHENKEEVKNNGNNEEKNSEKEKNNKEEVLTLKAEIKELKKIIDEAKVESEKLAAKLDAATSQISEEVALKEAVEIELVNNKKELREALEHSLNSFRAQAGKPMIKALESRSIDSLRDSIIDIKEEIESKSVKKVQITEATDPTIKDADAEKKEKKSQLNVKESNKNSNINLEEAFARALNSLK